MSSVPANKPAQLPSDLETTLTQARQHERAGEMDQAIATLAAALERARASTDDNARRKRFVLAMMLPQYYLAVGAVDKAIALLDTEIDFVDQQRAALKSAATTEAKQYAHRVYVELRDYQTRLKLQGQPAPEIDVKEWIQGAPTTLADVRGQVVLLEFWATWCKPCEQMFPKLTHLDDEFRAQGLNVIALTRHYMAYKGTTEAQAEEIKLMRKMVDDHQLNFRVGASEDEHTQDSYGAAGVPTMALIDRRGIVRHFFDGDEERFEQILEQCLTESTS